MGSGFSVDGFAGSNAESREISLAGQLIQYSWTHWDDSVDVIYQECNALSLNLSHFSTTCIARVVWELVTLCVNFLGKIKYKMQFLNNQVRCVQKTEIIPKKLRCSRIFHSLSYK